LDLSPGEFYKMLEDPAVFPTTAQINPAEFQAEFEKVLKESDDNWNHDRNHRYRSLWT